MLDVHGFLQNFPGKSSSYGIFKFLDFFSSYEFLKEEKFSPYKLDVPEWWTATA